MKFINRLLVFVSCYVLTSCVSYRYIDLQVLNPGSVKIPSSVKELHIAMPPKPERNYNVTFKDTSHRVSYYYKLYTDTFDSVLKSRLSESPLFSGATILVGNNTVNRSDKSTYLQINVPKLILTDTIKPMADFIDIDYRYEYYSLYSIYYMFKFELQNKVTGKYYDTYAFQDTVTWSSKSNYRDFADTDLPSTIRAISETAKIAAENYSEHLAAFWTTEERMLFFSNNKYMRKGYNLFLQNDLEGAIQTWKYLYDNGTAQLASIAAHNMGLMYEMMDDLANSELWLSNSLKIKWHFQTENYLNTIQKRENAAKKLDNELKSN